MAEVRWIARRVSDGVAVDVTADISGTVLPIPTQNAIEGGGGLGNPVTEPLTIEPTDGTVPSLLVSPPASLDPNNFSFKVDDITGADAFTVTGDGQVAILPTEVGAGSTVFSVADLRAVAAEESVFQLTGSGGVLSDVFTTGQFQFRTRHSDGGFRLIQSTAVARPFAVHGTSTSQRRFAVLSAGAPVIAQVAAPADADLNASEVALWFDATDGAAKLKIKGKSANGTVVSGEVALT